MMSNQDKTKSGFKFESNTVTYDQAASCADDLELFVGDVLNGKKKAKDLPLEPLIKLVQFTRDVVRLSTATIVSNTELEAVSFHYSNTKPQTLPVLSDTQCWCCEMGCGEVTPKEIDFEYSRSEDIKTGQLIESLTEKRYVSPCCGRGLFAWDNSTDDEVLVDGKPLTAEMPN